MKMQSQNITHKEGLTTTECIEYLSSPENPILEDIVAILISNYALDYISTGVQSRSYAQPPNEDYKQKLIAEIDYHLSINHKLRLGLYGGGVDVTKKNFTKYSEFVGSVGYQVSMLLDFPKTMSLFMDISSKKLYNKKDDTYIGLDLGTGSGILLLAQYIQARRNGFKDKSITNIGIDGNHDAVKIGGQLAKNLGFGTILHGDTTDIDTLRKLNLPHLTHVSNENLPDPIHPVHKEPFLKNLQTLLALYEELDDINFSPSNPIFIRGEAAHMIHIPELTMSSIEELMKDKNTRVTGILIDNSTVGLEQLGTQYAELFKNHRVGYAKRWASQ